MAELLQLLGTTTSRDLKWERNTVGEKDQDSKPEDVLCAAAEEIQSATGSDGFTQRSS
ncbi:hypothetical protein P4O66_021350, partial [Electrophorus voltai]